MSTWPTVLKEAFLHSRFAPYLAVAWVTAATTMTVAFWPEFPDPLDSFSGMGWRTLGLFLVSMGIGVWMSLSQGLDLQVSPSTVQLLPGLRRAATIVALVSWITMAAALALETCIFGVPFPWLFAGVLLCMAISASRNSALQKVGIVIIALLGPPIYGYRFPLPDASLAPWLPWGASLLAIALGANFIAAEFAKSAEAHASLHGRLVRRRSRDPHAGHAQSLWDLILKRPDTFQRWFDRVLRIRSPEGRVLLGMGTTFHWSHAVMGVVLQSIPMFLLMFALSRLFFDRESSDHPSIDPAVNMAAAGAFLFANHFGDFRMRELRARRKEQALLLLLPGAPTGREVNRWLIQTLVLQHAGAIVVAVWLVSGLAFALQSPLESTLKLTSAPFVVSVLFTPVLVRDYASLRESTPLKHMLLSILGMIALGFFVLFRRDSNPLVLMLIALILSGMIAAWRYARVADAPCAFPVGRLSS